MRLASKLLAGAAATVMMTGAVLAADIPVVVAPPMAGPVAAPRPTAPEYSFAGGYFGTHGGFTRYESETPARNWGLHGGVNFEFGPALVGLEFRSGLIWVNDEGFDGFYADINLHAGAAFGRVAVYGIAGVGEANLGPFIPYVNVGLGAEFMANSSLSVFGQVLRSTNAPFGGGPLGNVFQIGVNLR